MKLSASSTTDGDHRCPLSPMLAATVFSFEPSASLHMGFLDVEQAVPIELL